MAFGGLQPTDRVLYDPAVNARRHMKALGGSQKHSWLHQGSIVISQAQQNFGVNAQRFITQAMDALRKQYQAILFQRVLDPGRPLHLMVSFVHSYVGCRIWSDHAEARHPGQVRTGILLLTNTVAITAMAKACAHAAFRVAGGSLAEVSPQPQPHSGKHGPLPRPSGFWHQHHEQGAQPCASPSQPCQGVGRIAPQATGQVVSAQGQHDTGTGQ